MKNGYGKNKRLPEKFEAGMIAKLDGRTELKARLSATFNRIAEDCGGVESLPYARVALIERFAWLEEFLRQMELKLAAAPTEAEATLGRWIQGVNSMTGLCRMLGYQERAKGDWLDSLYSDAPEQAGEGPENELSDDEWDSSPDLEPRPQDGPRKPQKRKAKR